MDVQEALRRCSKGRTDHVPETRTAEKLFFRAILHWWKRYIRLFLKPPKDDHSHLQAVAGLWRAEPYVWRQTSGLKNIQVQASGKVACYWHAISRMTHIKQGWNAHFLSSSPSLIIEESYLQTFLYSLDFGGSACSMELYSFWSVYSLTSFLSWHSHTIRTFHPIASRADLVRLSRSLFVLSLLLQNSTFVEGMTA